MPAAGSTGSTSPGADLAALEAASAQLGQCPAWAALSATASRLQSVPLATLLDEPGRFAACSRRLGPLLLDFSRQRIDQPGIALLLQLAEERQLGAWTRALFAGEPVNNTEQRPALHMALRDLSATSLLLDGKDILPELRAERERMLVLAEAVRDGSFRGATGEPIRDVVNIGIGGSDLGLVMATQALASWQHPELRTHFVANIDGGELALLLEELDPASTLFVICSKSFTTLETRLNARTARDWLGAALGSAGVARHFVAVSVNAPAMDEFGIAPDLRLRLWDFVGGRYSLWSTIGLCIAIAIGREAFLELLRGAHELDQHFRSAPPADNLPVLLGLLGVWNRNHLGAHSHAVLPYDSRLARFPAYLQQLDMESNGKGVSRDGQPLSWDTGNVLWGEAGSNAQHSFFQLLHQGSCRVSLDFIAPARASSPFAAQHREGLANMLAQAEAFARGYEPAAGEVPEALRAHRRHPGNQPSNLLLLEALTPRTLGMLIALYEHRVFVQSVIWGINPFDQWGVERGKQLALQMSGLLDPATPLPEDAPGIVQLMREWGH